jgi:hypothetical protein
LVTKAAAYPRFASAEENASDVTWSGNPLATVQISPVGEFVVTVPCGFGGAAPPTVDDVDDVDDVGEECVMKMKTMPSTTAAAATRGTTAMALDCCRAGRDGRLLGVSELRIVFLSFSSEIHISATFLSVLLMMTCRWWTCAIPHWQRTSTSDLVGRKRADAPHLQTGR